MKPLYGDINRVARVELTTRQSLNINYALDLLLALADRATKAAKECSADTSPLSVSVAEARYTRDEIKRAHYAHEERCTELGVSPLMLPFTVEIPAFGMVQIRRALSRLELEFTKRADPILKLGGPTNEIVAHIATLESIRQMFDEQLTFFAPTKPSESNGDGESDRSARRKRRAELEASADAAVDGMIAAAEDPDSSAPCAQCPHERWAHDVGEDLACGVSDCDCGAFTETVEVGEENPPPDPAAEATEEGFGWSADSMSAFAAATRGEAAADPVMELEDEPETGEPAAVATEDAPAEAADASPEAVEDAEPYAEEPRAVDDGSESLASDDEKVTPIGRRRRKK